MPAHREVPRPPLLAALGGGAPHAPEFTRQGLLASYVAGADVLRLPLRLSKDERVVVLEDDTVSRLAGADGKVADLTLSELRKLDIGNKFAQADGTSFRYPARIEPLGLLLDVLPPSAWLLLQLTPEATPERMLAKVRHTGEMIQNRARGSRTIAAADDPSVLKEFLRAAPGAYGVVQAAGVRPAERIELAQRGGAQGVMLAASELLDAGGKPGPVAQLLERARPTLPLGAVVLLEPFAPQSYGVLGAMPGVGVVGVRSVIEAAETARPGWLWIEESWDRDAKAGEDVNADLWHLGYAKYNPEGYCHVYPDQGIHVEIAPFVGPVTYQSSGNHIADQLQELRERTWNANKDWPFYSGGGVGFVPGIDGDFSAEVDVESRRTEQATTVEMAALNVDPATHRVPWVKDAMGNLIPNPPATPRDKHTFFDPHGAPPYVGVEHDEDDGWRINWNLGNDYDSNQYGKAVGDGRWPTGRMRLDRRGS